MNFDKVIHRIKYSNTAARRWVQPAMFSEVVGQISCFYVNGKKNCPQKTVILDDFDHVNLGVVRGYKIINKELIKDEALEGE